MKSEVFAGRRYGKNSYFTIVVHDIMQYITLFPMFRKNLPLISSECVWWLSEDNDSTLHQT